MSEEATKSRALRRNLALWFALAAVLGVAAGYFFARSWPGGFLCSFAAVFSFDHCWKWALLEKDPRRWRLFLVGSVWHLLFAWTAIYVFQNIYAPEVREYRIQGIDSSNQRVGGVSEITQISTTP